jgi:hypothetical protein
MKKLGTPVSMPSPWIDVNVSEIGSAALTFPA